MAPNREKAKRLIVEILRQSESGLGKTKVFKAFWLAHLYYSKMAPGYLTDWPIVRMPNGPGLDRGDSPIHDLVAEELITTSHEPRGPYTEINCKLTDVAIKGDFSKEALDAIRAAVEDVKKQSASAISDWSHEFSRSWNTTPNGCELDIYTDLIPDDVYEERKGQLVEMKKAYEGLFE